MRKFSGGNIYGLPFNCVKETKIQCFQYKLLHRILPSNKFLYQIRYIDKPNCSFCDNEDETLEHLFFQCQYVFSLWESLKVYLQVNIDLNLNLSLQTILFGIVDQTSAKSANYIILMTKYYIYLCKCNNSKLNVNTALKFIHNKYKIRIQAGFSKLPKIEILFTKLF